MYIYELNEKSDKKIQYKKFFLHKRFYVVPAERAPRSFFSLSILLFLQIITERIWHKTITKTSSVWVFLEARLVKIIIAII